MRHCTSHKLNVVVENLGYIEMQGNETFKLAVRELSNVVEETLSANNLQKQISTGLCRIKRVTYYHRDSKN